VPIDKSNRKTRREIAYDVPKIRALGRKPYEIRREVQDRAKQRSREEAILNRTGKKLIFENSQIPKLTAVGLNRQLDWHRKNEKNYKAITGIKETKKVPRKSYMTNNQARRKELKKAIERFKARREPESFPVTRDSRGPPKVVVLGPTSTSSSTLKRKRV
jgi:hypothetical protein